jgi:antitoxin HicB
VSNEWSFGVEIRPEAGEFHAYCEGLPEAIAAGATEADALREMREAIVAAVRGRMKDGMHLVPPASQGAGQRVALPTRLAAKAAVYSAWRASGLSKVALGEKIGRSETEVRRLLDPDYGTKLDQLGEAADALGGRLSIAFTTAP